MGWFQSPEQDIGFVAMAYVHTDTAYYANP